MIGAPLIVIPAKAGTRRGKNSARGSGQVMGSDRVAASAGMTVGMWVVPDAR